MTTARPQPAFDIGDPLRAAERLAAICLAAAIVAGPVALGGTATWARLALEAAVAVAVALWAAAGSWPLRLVLAPLAVPAIAGLQIVPLPPGLLGLISPLAAAAWNDAAPADWGTVSLDPGVSATGVRRLLLGAAAIAAVADLARRDSNRRLLMRAMAAAAVIVWTLGLVFPVDPKTRILLGCVDLKGRIEFWKTEIEEPVATGGTGTYEWVSVGGVRHEMPAWSIGDGFGSYVISNHFAGALSLTVPIAIALWLRRSRGRMPSAARYCAALAIVAAATLTAGWLADSRAGAASMLLAGLVMLALAVEELPWRRIASALAIGYAALVLVGCLAFFGPWTGVREIVPEAARRPLQRLRGDGRVVATRVAGQMFAESPILGTGLDTFGELQPRYVGNVFHLHYAHNDYMQLLAETGVVGGSIAAGFVVLLIARSRRFCREATPPSRCLDAGPWAAIAGLALHSAFDWNLHVPANAVLAEVAAGLALSSVPLRGRGAVNRASPRLRRLAGGMLAVACLAAIALLARDTVSTAARRGLATAIVAARKAPATEAAGVESQLAEAIEAGSRASRWDPGDARLAVLVGQAHLHRAARRGEVDLAPGNLAAADEWFARARRSCAICRGVPEPLPEKGASR